MSRLLKLSSSSGTATNFYPLLALRWLIEDPGRKVTLRPQGFRLPEKHDATDNQGSIVNPMILSEFTRRRRIIRFFLTRYPIPWDAS